MEHDHIKRIEIRRDSVIGRFRHLSKSDLEETKMKQLGKLYVDLFYFGELTGNVPALSDIIFDFLTLPPELLAVFLKVSQLCSDIFKGKKPVFLLRFRCFRFHVQRVHDAFASSEQFRTRIRPLIRVQPRYVFEHAHSVFRLQRVVASHIFIDKIV